MRVVLKLRTLSSPPFRRLYCTTHPFAKGGGTVLLVVVTSRSEPPSHWMSVPGLSNPFPTLSESGNNGTGILLYHASESSPRGVPTSRKRFSTHSKRRHGTHMTSSWPSKHRTVRPIICFFGHYEYRAAVPTARRERKTFPAAS